WSTILCSGDTAVDSQTVALLHVGGGWQVAFGGGKGLGGARFGRSGQRHGAGCPSLAMGFASVCRATSNRRGDPAEDLRIHGSRDGDRLDQGWRGRSGR